VAVYLFTFHAYRSWMPDHRRGFVQRGKGILKPSPQMAQSYARRARFERMVFDDRLCSLIDQAAKEICGDRGWRLHAVVVVWSHLHALVSWQGFVDARRVRAVLHHGITTRLRDWTGRRRTWLARGGSLKRVEHRRHFHHHMTLYLPGHRRYGGSAWFEDAQR
jgi:REP element-mobilizing transposase RayT